MSLKIDRLLVAMAEHEGWGAVGDPQFPNGSRSFRYHNPGNLRASPFAVRIVENYAVFKNDTIGWLAFQWDILQKAKGNTSTGLGPNSTLRELIFKWAPPSDSNNSEAYLQNILSMTGFKEDMKLSEFLN